MHSSQIQCSHWHDQYRSLNNRGSATLTLHQTYPAVIAYFSKTSFDSTTFVIEFYFVYREFCLRVDVGSNVDNIDIRIVSSNGSLDIGITLGCGCLFGLGQLALVLIALERVKVCLERVSSLIGHPSNTCPQKGRYGQWPHSPSITFPCDFSHMSLLNQPILNAALVQTSVYLPSRNWSFLPSHTLAERSGSGPTTDSFSTGRLPPLNCWPTCEPRNSVE